MMGPGFFDGLGETMIAMGCALLIGGIAIGALVAWWLL